jgi:hypothetical protein
MGKFNNTCCSTENKKVIQGELLIVPQGGNLTYNFNNEEVSDVMITNLSSNVLKIEYTTLFSATGNKINYCAYGQTITLNTKDKTDLITEIIIGDTTNLEESKVIVNASRF